jgi:hypothetical protein
MNNHLRIHTYCVLLFCLVSATESVAQTFTGTELLARPTDHSITLNVVSSSALDAYIEYGTSSGVYTNTTSTASQVANEPIVIVIDGLSANTKYYYRLRYRVSGGGSYSARSEHTFTTQRPPGSTFSFDITSDSHVNIMLGTAATWQKTLTNVANDNPDFLLDLGDTFAMDGVSTESTARANYLFQRSSTTLGLVSPSVPIFIAVGNHENQEGWHISDNEAIWATNAQKRYFPNPVPNDFYTGNTDTYSALNGDQLHEDYYAWTWGDVLFVVIDPFWYSTAKPFIGNTGGGEPGTSDGDRWHWTLGQTQYNWLKQTLENSHATYKFLFMHHMTGGTDDYIRGGAYAVPYCEWGGYNEDGTTYNFSNKRPGWYAPIEQVLVENNVTAVFHGHDHQYAYEKRDGIVYQSMPSAGFSGNGFGIYSNGGYTLNALPSPGHLRVTVTPSLVTVDYINTTSGQVTYSYPILSNLTVNTSAGFTLTNPMTISGTLTFALGNLYLGNNNLTLSGSVVGAGAGHCIVTNGTGGVVRNVPASSAVVFPIGADATHYNPITLTSNASHTADNFTVRATAGPLNPAAPNNNQAVQVTWNIAEAIVGGSSVIVNLGWNSSQHGAGFSTSAASIWHYDAGSSVWQDLFGSAVTGTDPYTLSTASSVSSFSPFCVGNSGALPVELTSFTAVLQGTSALLKWTTATETHNSGFQIERNVEGSTIWEKVVFVEGAGTSSSPKTYSYEDKNLVPGAYAYRMKQVDNDGTSTIYNPYALPKVDAGVSNTFTLGSNYPNPFNPTTNIQFSVPQDGYASLKVYNTLGQEVATLFSGMVKTGHYIPATFDASRFASGIYFARLQYNGKCLVQRMLLTK